MDYTEQKQNELRRRIDEAPKDAEGLKTEVESLKLVAQEKNNKLLELKKELSKTESSQNKFDTLKDTLIKNINNGITDKQELFKVLENASNKLN